MQYRNLGKTGTKVSEICLGTMMFGSKADEATSLEIIDLAFDAGINFIDTANTYTGTRSETIVGKGLKGRRQDVILASKFTNPTGKGPNDSGMGRVHIMQAVEQSLKRLQTDYLDIYYIHHIDRLTPLEEALRALDDLVHQGKVRYIACSNFEAWRINEGLWISELRNLAKFVCYQPQYSLVVRDIEHEIVPFCIEKGIGIIPWGPLAAGFLSGKFKPGQRLIEGTRSDGSGPWFQNFWAENADDTLKVMLEVAEELGKTPAQIATRWVLDQPGISAVITGVSKTYQLRDNVGATGWTLPEEAMARLNEVSALKPRYPLIMEAKTDERRWAAIDMPSL